MLWRHGDVLLASTENIPAGAVPLSHTVLAKGEITGHSHRIAEPGAATLWELNGLLYLKVSAESATLMHEEHKPIVLPGGFYRVWQQREYTPAQIRRVMD
ncbi:MAG TPA: hypothetical protein VH186_29775 [Chloroflexia bacterium]|nr:hypothetical protein [Chloroflexia bacterium]